MGCGKLGERKRRIPEVWVNGDYLDFGCISVIWTGLKHLNIALKDSAISAVLAVIVCEAFTHPETWVFQCQK